MKNSEGYTDVTASLAIGRADKKIKEKGKKKRMRDESSYFLKVIANELKDLNHTMGKLYEALKDKDNAPKIYVTNTKEGDSDDMR